MRATISRRLLDELSSVVKAYGDDYTRIDYAAWLYQIETKDTRRSAA